MRYNVIWEYEVDFAMDDKNRYYPELVKKWKKNHIERTREINLKANLKYYHNHKNDEEFMEERRQTNRDRHRRILDTGTPEEIEEYRRKNREKVARYRARQKAKKEQES